MTLFFRLPVTSAQCVIGREKNAVALLIITYDVDDYSQGYPQIKKKVF